MEAIHNVLKVEHDEDGMRAYHKEEAGRQFSCSRPRNKAETTRATSYLCSDPSSRAVVSTEALQGSTHASDSDSRSAAGVIRPDGATASGAKRNGARSVSCAEQMGLTPITRPEIARYGLTNRGSSSSCSRSNAINMQGTGRGTSEEEGRRPGLIEEETGIEMKLSDQEKLRDQLQKFLLQKLSQGELDHAGTMALTTLSKLPPPPPGMSPRSKSSLLEKYDNSRTHSGGSREKQRLPPGVENLPKFSGKEPSALTDVLNRFRALVVHALPESTADQVNRALLRDLVFVLEGCALEYYIDLRNGHVAWEPVPPGEGAGQQVAAGGSPSIKPPSTWVEICEAMHDHFLPAQGVARTAKALLNLRQAPGESVSSLATRQVGLCHHLNRLVDANGGQPTYWDAISMALFEKALRADLRRAHEAEPPCSSFQDSVNRAERNAAAAARHASDMQRGSAVPGETAAFSTTPASAALGPGSPEAGMPLTVSSTATTPVAVTTTAVHSSTFRRGSSDSSLEGKEDQHKKTLKPAETLPWSPTPSSNNDAGGPPAAPNGNGVGGGVNEAGCNSPSFRRTNSSNENIRGGNKKRTSACSGNEIVTVKCEAAIDVKRKKRENNHDHADNLPTTAELPRKSHRSGSIKRSCKGTISEKRRRTPSPRHPLEEGGQSVSTHSDHVHYNSSSSGRSGLFVDRHTFSPSSPRDVQAPGGSSCETQSPFESFGGQGGGNWAGGGSFPDYNDQPTGGVKKNVTWSKDTLHQHQNKHGAQDSLHEDWASRGRLSQHESQETTVDDCPPCTFPRCRAINRNSHSTKDCRFRTGEWPLKRQEYQNERGWRNPRSYRNDAIAGKPVVNTVEPAIDGGHKAWGGMNDGSSGGERSCF